MRVWGNRCGQEWQQSSPLSNFVKEFRAQGCSGFRYGINGSWLFGFVASLGFWILLGLLEFGVLMPLGLGQACFSSLGFRPVRLSAGRSGLKGLGKRQANRRFLVPSGQTR